MKNVKQRMKHENVASEWYPFKIKPTKAFQCPAMEEELGGNRPKGQGERNQRRRYRNA
jgi:hypothetical protein